MIWLSTPHMSGTEQGLIDEVFAKNLVMPLGPMLDRFEQDFAEYLGEGVHCCAVSSGTAALHLVLRAAGVEQGDDVWTTSMTFAGGSFPILYQGATPTFFDVSPQNWGLCPEMLADAMAQANKANTLPKAVIPTDLYGQSVDLDALQEVCSTYGVKLLVDSAESAGANYKDRKAGTGGDAAILSFNGNKIITTGGGGMVVSRDAELVERCRFLSTQARDPAPHYQHTTYGYNYRMSGVAAAIGVGQLAVLDDRIAARRRVGDRYRTELGEFDGVSFMPEPNWSHSSRWLTALTLDPETLGVDREQMRLHLHENGVESRPLWKPMHMQPLFEGTRYVGSGIDEEIFKQGLCLPSSSNLTEEDQTTVIEAFRNLVEWSGQA